MQVVGEAWNGVVDCPVSRDVDEALLDECAPPYGNRALIGFPELLCDVSDCVGRPSAPRHGAEEVTLRGTRALIADLIETVVEALLRFTAADPSVLFGDPARRGNVPGVLAVLLQEVGIDRK